MALSALLRRPAPAGPRKRLLLAIDDTPTARYGPCVEGAGIHHNPSPGPAGEKFVYGHVWVTLAALAQHPDWGTIALPLQAQLYIRAGRPAPSCRPSAAAPFRTKLELAAEQLRWLKPWVDGRFEELWVVVDGGYAKRPFLRPARTAGWVVVSRLRKDAALWSLPPAEAAGPARAAADLRQGADRPGQAGRADSAAGSRWSACSTARR